MILDNPSPRTIPFRRWHLALFGILSSSFTLLLGFVLLWVQPDDITGFKWLGFAAFGAFMAWFASYNGRLLWRSYRRNVAIEMNNEGFWWHGLQPSIDTPIRWEDIQDLKTVSQNLLLTRIAQLHIVVPNAEPYISAQHWLAAYIRRRQKSEKPITLVINVRQAATNPEKLADYMEAFLQLPK